MKKFFPILIFITIISTLWVLQAFSQVSNATTDSLKTTLLQFSQTPDLSTSAFRPHVNSHHDTNPQVDCNELLADASDPRIKIFEPDTTLTAAMPILTPERVDLGIFIPEFRCFEPDSID